MIKYEVYIPDRFIDIDGSTRQFDKKFLNKFMKDIIDICKLSLNVSGISVREEKGYYRDGYNSVNKIKSKVIQFYGVSGLSISGIGDRILRELKQDSVLFMVNGGAVMYCG